MAPDNSPQSDINNKAKFLSRDPFPTSGAEIPHRHAMASAATLMTLIGPGGKIKQHLRFYNTELTSLWLSVNITDEDDLILNTPFQQHWHGLYTIFVEYYYISISGLSFLHLLRPGGDI